MKPTRRNLKIFLESKEAFKKAYIRFGIPEPVAEAMGFIHLYMPAKCGAITTVHFPGNRYNWWSDWTESRLGLSVNAAFEDDTRRVCLNRGRCKDALFVVGILAHELQHAWDLMTRGSAVDDKGYEGPYRKQPNEIRARAAEKEARRAYRKFLQLLRQSAARSKNANAA